MLTFIYIVRFQILVGFTQIISINIGYSPGIFRLFSPYSTKVASTSFAKFRMQTGLPANRCSLAECNSFHDRIGFIACQKQNIADAGFFPSCSSPNSAFRCHCCTQLSFKCLYSNFRVGNCLPVSTGIKVFSYFFRHRTIPLSIFILFYVCSHCFS